MDILTQKRITDNGDGKGYFIHCILYLYKPKLEPGEYLIEVKGYGVCDTNPEYTYSQMMAVKEYYGKTGDNPVIHFVVSYDKSTVNDVLTALDYTEKIAVGFFKGKYQLLTAVHKEYQGSSYYHAHFVVNTVELSTGKLYHSGIKELNEFAKFIYELTGNYCKTEIKYDESKKNK